MGRLSEEAVMKNAAIVEKLIDALPTAGAGVVRHEKVKAMFEAIGKEFFTAPASSREDFHGCFPGGLCDHSLRVAGTLRTLAETLAPGKFPKEQLIFVGLMHDLGKIGDGERPLYVPNPSDWHRKNGMLYVTNKSLPYMPVCDRTMFLLQKFGIVLTDEEYTAIRISDGPYEKSNEKYGMKEPDLALLLHFSDRWACQQEKQLA